MCCKNEIQTKVLSFQSSKFSKFYQTFFRTLRMLRNKTATQKRVQDFYKSDTLVRTNQIKYDCFFSQGTQNTKKLFSQDVQAKKKSQ